MKLQYLPIGALRKMRERWATCADKLLDSVRVSVLCIPTYRQAVTTELRKSPTQDFVNLFLFTSLSELYYMAIETSCDYKFSTR